MAKNKVSTPVSAPVKGGKSGKTRERRSFSDRALQAPKVLEALTALGVDHKAFEKAYSLTRKTREAGPMSDTVKAALASFPEHRSIAKLADAIGKSNLTAANLLARAIETGIVKLA